ncbi:MAG: WG repeat-containing protein [Bacteroidales bacterium]|jgi:hypothetical protein|nr:WG repeat-containing protein [Bacteroidales bacterium]
MKEKRYVTENDNENIQDEKKKSVGFGVLILIIVFTFVVPRISPWLGHISCLLAIYCLISNRYYTITRIIASVMLVIQVFLFFIVPQMNDGSIGQWIFYKHRKMTIFDKIHLEDIEMYPKYNLYFEKWGFVDGRDNNVIFYKYDKAHEFSEGLARVQLNGKYGFINKAGEEVIPFIYNEAYDFHNGFAFVTLGKKSFYIDKKGKKKPVKKDMYFNSNHEGLFNFIPQLGTSHAVLFVSFPNWERATQSCLFHSQIGNEPRSPVYFIPKLGTSHAQLLQS